MKQTSVFRVTGDICFYFAVLNVFSVFRAWRLPMALFTALCFALGFVIVRCRQGAARFALSVLPALSFLLSPLQPLLLFPAIAWVYYMLVMVRGNYVMPLYEYRKSFSVLLAICLFFLAANIANATIYWGQVISAESLAYAFAFLLLGVTAMRRMQMGAEMPLNWRLRNAASVVGLPVLAVGVSLLLFLLLRFSQGALRAILEPVGRFFLWLFHKLFPDKVAGHFAGAGALFRVSLCSPQSARKRGRIGSGRNGACRRAKAEAREKGRAACGKRPAASQGL